MESSVIHLASHLAFLADAASGSAPGEQNGLRALFSMMPFILIFVMMYFIMIRPQQIRAKEHARLLTQLKKNDKVVTTGGVVGVIVSVNDKTVSIRSADSKLEINKSAVSELVTDAGSSSK